MKYIIVNPHDIEVAIIFDELLTHVQVAVGIPLTVVVSAGYCNDRGDVWGGSITLQKTHRPEDSGIIKQTMKRTSLI